MGTDLDKFLGHHDKDNDWPVIEGQSVAPSRALASNRIYFYDAFAAWSGLDDEPDHFEFEGADERDDSFDAYVNGERPTGWEIDGFEIAAADVLATDADRYRQVRCARVIGCAFFFINPSAE
jgi:hypothetical protein